MVRVKASAKRKAHDRTINVFRSKKHCFCTLPKDAAPAKSPDFNICENLFNEITTRLAEKALMKVGHEIKMNYENGLTKLCILFQRVGFPKRLTVCPIVGQNASKTLEN